MSDEILKINIPLDDDGYMDMECDYCKNRFMLHYQVYKCEENIHFFCPICGLPNGANTFYVPEVIEKARQIALNYMLMEFDRTLGKSVRHANRNGLFSISMKIPEIENEKELFISSNEYVKCDKECCKISVKVKYIDKETGIYCPICGRS